MVLLPFSLLPLLTIRQVKIMTFFSQYLQKELALNVNESIPYNFVYVILENLKPRVRWMKIIFTKSHNRNSSAPFAFKIIAYIRDCLVPVP